MTANPRQSLIRRCWFAANLVLLAASGSVGQERDVNIKPVREVTYYRWVTFLTQSAIEPHPNPTPGATLRALRVVLATVEGEERIYLESMVFGPEECCNRLDQIFLIDLIDLAQVFSLQPPMTNVTFSRWLSSRSFSFLSHHREFMVSLTDSLTLGVVMREGSP